MGHLALRMKSRNKHHTMFIYMMSIFVTFFVAIPSYINSTFLGTFVDERIVGILYSAGAALTFVGLFAMSRALERFGIFVTSLIVFILAFLSAIGLASFQNPLLIVVAFAVYFLVTSLVYFILDVYLEHYTKESEVGSTRGTYMTILNLAWVFAPALAGFLTESGGFSLVYAATFALLIPAAFILISKFSHFKDTEYKHISLVPTMRRILKNRDLRGIFSANFLLRLFFAWMVIYTPLYLHETIGFDFSTIGTIFTIMLIAYVIVEYPVGKLADKKYGEREFMLVGYVIVAVSTAILSFIVGMNIVLWTGVLFLTRVGAAMLEVTNESYFFKHVSKEDTDELGFFRMIRPLSYIVAPILASGFLLLFDLQYIFLAMGIVMLSGVIIAYRLHDTK